jgi:hypothetical protein
MEVSPSTLITSSRKANARARRSGWYSGCAKASYWAIISSGGRVREQGKRCRKLNTPVPPLRGWHPAIRPRATFAAGHPRPVSQECGALSPRGPALRLARTKQTGKYH